MAENAREKPAAGKGQPNKKPDSSGKWVVVIVLFALGLWPLALLVWFGWNWLFRGGGRRLWEGKVPQTRGRNEKKNARSVSRRIEAARDNGKRLRVVGIVLLVVSFFVLAEPVDDLVWLGTVRYSIGSLFMGLGFLTAGAVSLGRGIFLARLFHHSRRYIAAVGDEDCVELDLIARRVGDPPEQAARRLERLIDHEFFGADAYLDRELGCFLRFGAEEEQRRRPVQQAETAQTAGESAPPEADQADVLRQLRALNDRIAGEELSAKIDRLEQITGQILRETEEHPEKREKIHTFFDYYLPTTLKLLESYADFEEAGVEGENLKEAKRRIEATMDGLLEGFAHQLDALYHSDAMDVATDIQVLESMLQRDTASAARDFQYQKYQQSGAAAESEAEEKTSPPSAP